ncbi:MAG: hypothetical protein PHS83_04095 [Clostridia bacterium]|jgi:hypothetical protein|nr:hypothetical protein [Clostridia bacterium]MDD4146263.1 hypothetical protein [Clostridia bacterium]MDD4665838.1 hypothetical protein [Clostridia bacterium]
MKERTIFLRKIKIVFLFGLVALISYCFYFFVFTSLSAEGELQFGQTNELYDLVIKHALILDGTGEKERFRGDIAIRDGCIVEVGSVSEVDSPAFDAGGLTVMPMPVRPVNMEKAESVGGGILEHLLRTSYPRYPSSYLYFQDEPYCGLNLAQVAQQRGESPQKTFYYVQKQLPAMSKIYLLPLGLAEEKLLAGTASLQELAAYLTGYPAKVTGNTDLGMIKPNYKADLYFFITDDYEEESLKQLFLKGELPALALCCKKGQLLAQ